MKNFIAVFFLAFISLTSVAMDDDTFLDFSPSITIFYEDSAGHLRKLELGEMSLVLDEHKTFLKAIAEVLFTEKTSLLRRAQDAALAGREGGEERDWPMFDRYKNIFSDDTVFLMASMRRCEFVPLLSKKYIILESLQRYVGKPKYLLTQHMTDYAAQSKHQISEIVLKAVFDSKENVLSISSSFSIEVIIEHKIDRSEGKYWSTKNSPDILNMLVRDLAPYIVGKNIISLVLITPTISDQNKSYLCSIGAI